MIARFGVNLNYLWINEGKNSFCFSDAQLSTFFQLLYLAFSTLPLIMWYRNLLLPWLFRRYCCSTQASFFARISLLCGLTVLPFKIQTRRLFSAPFCRSRAPTLLCSRDSLFFGPLPVGDFFWHRKEPIVLCLRSSAKMQYTAEVDKGKTKWQLSLFPSPFFNCRSGSGYCALACYMHMLSAANTAGWLRERNETCSSNSKWVLRTMRVDSFNDET